VYPASKISNPISKFKTDYTATELHLPIFYITFNITYKGLCPSSLRSPILPAGFPSSLPPYFPIHLLPSTSVSYLSFSYQGFRDEKIREMYNAFQVYGLFDFQMLTHTTFTHF
jgi:hypothetical protein